jgi:hypothetical protein
MTWRLPVKQRSAPTVLLVIAAALMTPAALPAQFTTFVAPPRKDSVISKKPSVVAVAKARADSASRMSLTDMKAWVDSAAGTPAPVTAVADTAMATVDTVASPSAKAAQHTTTSFSNGAIAPNTATALPLLFATGFASLAVGLLLFGLRRRRA